MKYLRVKWLHDFQDMPIILYSELDENRFEIRKVEIFPDGRKGFASQGESFGSTELGDVPIPSINEIAKDPEFLPEEITRDEFEKIWHERF